MIRQKRIDEQVSITCFGCQFLTHLEGCSVPGGTCCNRGIEGVPGQYVGDILANTRIIMSQWRRQDKQKVENRDKVDQVLDNDKAQA